MLKILCVSLGLVSMKLGGGRETKDDEIDHSVGLILNKKVSDFVKEDETLIYVHTNTGLSDKLQQQILDAFVIVDEKVEKPILIEYVM